MSFIKTELHKNLHLKAPKRELMASEFSAFCHANMGQSPTQLRCQIDAWLAEDSGAGDVSLFAALKENAARKADFFIVAKSSFVMCGRELMAEVFRRTCGENIRLYSDIADGTWVETGSVVLWGQGSAGGILLGERVALNLSCKLSGIATKTKKVIDDLTAAAKGPVPSLLETRKTTPGLRSLEKYATRTAGARNHRHGLDSGAMLKENHLRMLKNDDLSVILKNLPVLTKLEVEVTNLEELKTALSSKVDVAMLDNFKTQDDIKSAVELRNKISPNTKLELSGNLDRQSAEFLANSGVDFFSQGALIHQATWIDMSLQMFASEA